ncbi:hypothetical protein ETA_34170 [Erwinia tasmaniensis Et1/99]|uniref:Uncharacterized protein n=1 Tax=Erwinia tasmaniensis (strain DSM 17950 / CFBP 7177 / CIP 109463 / NCPPB 4357 / Et1/99) TaxID=465817 RepID=B2VCH5_ERWT9|nr:hypothetical protein ETA_34170 [Erwinia tasmaniensis Et1/99]
MIHKISLISAVPAPEKRKVIPIALIIISPSGQRDSMNFKNGHACCPYLLGLSRRFNIDIE